MTRRSPSFLLTPIRSGMLLVAAVTLLLLPRMAVSQNENERSAGHFPAEQIREVILDLKNLYQDVEPLLKTLERYRDQDASTNQINDVKQKILNKRSRIEEINTRLTRIDPPAQEVKKMLKQLQHLEQLLDKYIEKTLKNEVDRSQKNRRRSRGRTISGASSKSRVSGGSGSLRERYLIKLEGKLNSFGLLQVLGQKKLMETENKLWDSFWTLVSRFLDQLDRIQKAKSETEDQEDADQQDDHQQKSEKTLQDALDASRKNWNQFWSTFETDWDRQRKTVNRFLLLYRNRTNVIAEGKKWFQEGLRIKKIYVQLQKFRKESIFSSLKRTRKRTQELGKIYLSKSHSLLGNKAAKILGHFVILNRSINQLKRFHSQKKETKEENTKHSEQPKKTSSSRFSTMKALIEYIRGRLQNRLNLSDLISQLDQFPQKTLSRLADHLIEQHKSRKKKKQNSDQDGDGSDEKEQNKDTDKPEKSGEDQSKEEKLTLGELIKKISDFMELLDRFTRDQKELRDRTFELARSSETGKAFQEKFKDKLAEKRDRLQETYEKLYKKRKKLVEILDNHSSSDSDNP